MWHSSQLSSQLSSRVCLCPATDPLSAYFCSSFAFASAALLPLGPASPAVRAAASSSTAAFPFPSPDPQQPAPALEPALASAVAFDPGPAPASAPAAAPGSAACPLAARDAWSCCACVPDCGDGASSSSSASSSESESKNCGSICCRGQAGPQVASKSVACGLSGMPDCQSSSYPPTHLQPIYPFRGLNS